MEKLNCEKQYKIFTMDDDGYLLVGHLEVQNRDLLCVFRDFLAKDSCDNFELFQRNASCANGIKVPNVEVADNCLIERDDFKKEYIKTFYKEHVYKPLNLNTFLLCSSLLGDMNVPAFESMANKFAGQGIFRLMPIAEAWTECSKNFYCNFDSQDFETFSDLLADGRFVSYVIDDAIKYRNLKEAKILSSLKIMLDDDVCMDKIDNLDWRSFLKKVSHDSKVLGTCKMRRRSR